MFPRADVPVLQVSIGTRALAGAALRAGARVALSARRRRADPRLGRRDAQSRALHSRARPHDESAPPEWVEAFNEWTAGAIAGRRFDDLLHYAERAPFAAQNHPTAEHYLPLFVTLGAAHDDEPGVRIHSSYDRGLLSLDAYAFGLAPPAPREIRMRVPPSRPTVLH